MPPVWINIHMKHIFLITLLFTLLTGCSTWEDKWFQKEWEKLDKEAEQKNDNN
jgi:hypothetical protein